MQLAEHYLRLRHQLPLAVEEQEIEITHQELATILFCTTRNVKNVIKQMIDMDWIIWVPGRGRGNHSILTFLVSAEKIVFEVAKHLVAKGDIREAFERIQAEAPSLKESFTEWLSQQFGHAVEMKEKKKIDTFRFAFVRPIGLIDPAFVIHRKDLHMLKQIFDGLVRFNGQTKEIEAHIAHYWEVDKTGTEWLFYLQKGVMFHHGRELTAHDVTYTLERLKDSKLNSPFQWMFEQIEEINILHDHHLQIKLMEPNHLFLHLLCTDQASIVPQDVSQELGTSFGKKPIGTGPFRFVQSNEKLFVLEAFKPHFKGAPHLDRVEMWVVAEPNFEDLQAYQMSYHPFRQASLEWKEIERLEIGGMHFTFNLNKKGPQQHISFRRAFHHAIDRPRLIEELGGKRARPASSFLPYLNDQQYEQSYNPELTKKLIQESGYSEEPLKLYTYEKYYNEQDIVWIKNQCEQFGISLAIKVFPVDKLFQEETMQDADIILSAETLDDNIEFTMLQQYQTANSVIKNHLGPKLTSLVQEKISLIKREPLREIRLTMVKQLEHMLREEYFVVFLYHYRQKAIYDPTLQGLSFNSLGWVNFKDLWVKVN